MLMYADTDDITEIEVVISTTLPPSTMVTRCGTLDMRITIHPAIAIDTTIIFCSVIDSTRIITASTITSISTRLRSITLFGLATLMFSFSH